MSHRRFVRRLVLGASSLAALAVVLVGTVLVDPAHATSPGANGLIAFVRGGNIYTANAQGGAVTQVTRSMDLSGPRWSPDGKRLAYKSNAGVVSVRTMASGRTVRLGTGANANPVWSGDGTRVAWSARNPDADDCDHTYVVMAAPATGTSAATTIAAPDNACPYEDVMKLGDWSRDGSKLLLTFCGTWQAAACAVSQWTLAPLTRGSFLAATNCAYEGEEDASPQICTHYLNLSPAVYGPDGKQAVFSGHGRGLPRSNPIQPAGAQDRVYAADASGANLHVVSTSTTGYSPVWSPDGKSILFAQKGSTGTNILKTGTTATSNASVLIRNGSQPDWQPLP
jgi:Tol biopolymer transport system component